MGEAERGLSSSESAQGLPLPRLLARRILLKLAARGGMGDVYLAATTGIEGAERPCIVKTVRRDHMHDGSFLARFLDEARVQAQLQHPGVAQVLEAATDDEGEPFTVVEYVEGRSLSDIRQRAIQSGVKVTWPDALAIALEIAQALGHVHERSGPDGSPLGIVHRDLSPQNVMVGYAGEVKLIDFGTARGHNRRCHTVAGVVFAKPGYVAPEVARQQVGDGRIDLYALGIMLWELCAGRRFLACDPQRHLDDAAAGRLQVAPVAAACGAPGALDEVIAKLTHNDPDERYARASLACADLAKVLATAPATDAGERGVRARIALLMRKLWPHEPGRSRGEFARLLRDARETLRAQQSAGRTPAAGAVSEAMAARLSPNDPAMVLGTPYRLRRKIGEGASGAVWEAEHTELARPIALKILAPEHASSAGALERFRREARAVASLSHPNLVGILDFGKSLDGRVFLAMELLVGETLDAKIRRGPLPWREAARICVEAARGLSAAHAAGLVHRDIKPQNLMLTTDGAVKLLDFGVAMALTESSGPKPPEKERALRGFAIFGTPEYMAPEQIAGDPIDGRTDLYALGCVLYEMLTGERAFDGGSSVVVMGKQLRETPQPPRVRVPSRSIPAAIDTVAMRALSKRPDERFASADAMRAALEEALGAPERRRARARRLVTTMATSVAVAAAAAGSAAWTRAHVPAMDPATAVVLVGATMTATATATAAAPASAPATATASSFAPPPALASAVALTPTAEPPPALVIPSVPLREARAAARAHPSDPRALETWTHAALRAGELREARRAVGAWALRDGTVEPRLALAEIYEASGRRGDARAVLAEWLELHPDSADARAAFGRLSSEVGSRGRVPEGSGRHGHESETEVARR
jgi:serine/threonine-protein kinase